MKSMKLLIVALALLIPAMGFGMRRGAPQRGGRPTAPALSPKQQEFIKYVGGLESDLRKELGVEPHQVLPLSRLATRLDQAITANDAATATKILDVAAALGYTDLVIKGLKANFDVSQLTKDIEQPNYITALRIAGIKVPPKPPTTDEEKRKKAVAEAQAVAQQAQDLAATAATENNTNKDAVKAAADKATAAANRAANTLAEAEKNLYDANAAFAEAQNAYNTGKVTGGTPPPPGPVDFTTLTKDQLIAEFKKDAKAFKAAMDQLDITNVRKVATTAGMSPTTVGTMNKNPLIISLLAFLRKQP